MGEAKRKQELDNFTFSEIYYKTYWINDFKNYYGMDSLKFVNDVFTPICISNLLDPQEAYTHYAKMCQAFTLACIEDVNFGTEFINSAIEIVKNFQPINAADCAWISYPWFKFSRFTYTTDSVEHFQKILPYLTHERLTELCKFFYKSRLDMGFCFDSSLAIMCKYCIGMQFDVLFKDSVIQALISSMLIYDERFNDRN